MSKKFNKIMSVVLALMMVCSLLPMSAMAAENDTYTVTFAPGTLCDYTGEGAYPTTTYDGTGDFLLPEPADLGLVGSLENITFQGWTQEGVEGKVYQAGDNVADLITGDVTFLANYVAVVTFEPGRLCAFVPDLSVEEPDYNYATAIYNGTGVITLPNPADVRIFPLRDDTMVFDGWILKGTTEPVYAIGDDVTNLITENISFVANFKEKPVEGTVTYYIEPGQIGSFENQTVTIGPIPPQYLLSTSLPVNEEDIENEMHWTIPNNYEFAFWEDPDGPLPDAGNGRTEEFIPVDNFHYIAHWNEKTVETYTVTLNPGKIGETAVPANPVFEGPFEEGYEFNRPAEDTFTYEGYRIVDWQYANGDSASFPIELHSDITLYAVWADTTPVNVWTVTLYPGEGAEFQPVVTGYINVNGTLVGYAPKDIKEYNIDLSSAYDLDADGKNATFLKVPENMEFAGWKITSPEETAVYYGGQLITVTSDTTFTAQWREKGEGPYNLIYNAGLLASYTVEGTTVYNRNTAVSVPAGGTETLPADIDEIEKELGWSIPENYRFVAWIDPGSNTPDEPIKEITDMEGDVTVVALWENTDYKEWTITFDAGDGSGTMEPVTIRTGAASYSYTLPDSTFTPPTGQVFAYWTVSGMTGEFQPGASVTIEGDVTVTAHWRPETYYYLVTFDPGEGGSGEMAPVFIESASEIADFYVPYCTFTAPEGKTFDVWLDQNGDPYFPGDTVKIGSDLTLTAQWMDSTANFTMG